MAFPALEIPIATYRLQLNAQLRFEDVRRLVAYLSRLGIGAAYLSPVFRACKGSPHGYDVVDHRQLNPELGSEREFGRLAKSLRERNMGLLMDLVPNHMGIDDPHNAWWQDVLENGPSSPFARYFDIDWNPPKEALHGKVLLPTLGDQFGKALEDRQIQLAYEEQRFVIAYFDRRFPTDPSSWVGILRQLSNCVGSRLAPEAQEQMELESIISALDHLPPQTETSSEAAAQRYREKEVARRRLSALLEASREMQAGLEETLAEYSGRRGDPASFDKLEALLAQQTYRLCYWRVATDEINYRRFFDVDALAAIRVEEPEVFAAIHELVLRFVAQGWVTGLRIDHADGLLDPQQYLNSLADVVRNLSDPHAPPLTSDLPIYTVVEKILASDEALPGDWRTHGTTGYDFLDLLNGLFVDRVGGYALRQTYARFVGYADNFAHVLYESKRTILATSLSSELYMLSNTLDRISEQHRWSRDFTRPSLFRALREVVACFPVYRTYIRPGSDDVREEDRRRILSAVRAAKRRNPAMSPSFFDFIASVLLLEDPEGISGEDRQLRRAFVLKSQQITGPVTAKGWEDTAFYRYYPLTSLNEVGGDPTTPGTTVEQFHRRISERMTRWPHAMLATGTHDTKRGEDARARLNVLSEIPDDWAAAVERWQAMNAASRVELDGAVVPDANEEYLIYQTLVGTWPISHLDALAQQDYVERMVRYLDKALREAKLHTSWLNPYEEYDQAVANFIRTILADWQSPFVVDLGTFAASIANAGFVNSLAQTLVKMCVPGVPDFYQGVEFWDFRLVDPDNRGPVDFALRERQLKALAAKGKKDLPGLVKRLLADWPDERVKMFLIWRTLQFRGQQRALFDGDYVPLAADGPRKAQLCAFARVAGQQWAICAVPRLTYPIWSEIERPRQAARGKSRLPSAEWWRETYLQLPPEAPRLWRDVMTGRELPAVDQAEGGSALDVAELFGGFPVALLSTETV